VRRPAFRGWQIIAIENQRGERPLATDLGQVDPFEALNGGG